MLTFMNNKTTIKDNLTITFGPNTNQNEPPNRTSAADTATIVSLLQTGKKVNSFNYHVLQIGWHIFGTITWRKKWMRQSGPGPKNKREQAYYFMVSKCCQLRNVRVRDTMSYIKHEQDASGQYHLHFLLSFKKPEEVCLGDFVRTIRWYWRPSVGRASVKRFNIALHQQGVTYVTKLEERHQRNGEVPEESFSKPLWNQMQRNADAKDQLSLGE